jgi:hypothetical protein
MRQLDIFGNEVDYPPPAHRALTYRQHELIGYLHMKGPMRASKVPTHRNPWGALRRLEMLGLVSRGFDGRWQAR